MHTCIWTILGSLCESARVWLFMCRYFKILFRGGREGAAPVVQLLCFSAGGGASPRGKKGPAPVFGNAVTRLGKLLLKGKLLVGSLPVSAQCWLPGGPLLGLLLECFVRILILVHSEFLFCSYMHI